MDNSNGSVELFEEGDEIAADEEAPVDAPNDAAVDDAPIIPPAEDANDAPAEPAAAAAEDAIVIEDDDPPVRAEAEGSRPDIQNIPSSVSRENDSMESPVAKRKRLSLASPKSRTPNLKSSKKDGHSDEEEDDGATCPVCLDNWEMSGEHRLVSLKCGHLFGESCIKRWLNESARQTGVKSCPQCKAKSTNKDIRCLYAKRIRAVDRTEEHELRKQLEEERLRTVSLKTSVETLQMSYTMVMKKIAQLEAENKRMKLLLESGAGGGAYSFDADGTLAQLKMHKLFMERNIEVSRQPGCRVLIYAPQSSTLIASQKSCQTLFPGYGLRFIDSTTFRPTDFMFCSPKLLRDVCLSADQQTLGIASMETKTKIFDLRTRQVAAQFSPGDRTLWACAMDRSGRENFLYLGAQHGSTYVYDVRFPETIVEEFKSEGDCSPVINIAPVAANKVFPNGGFLVCKLQSILFYEYDSSSGTAAATRLNVDGPFISMSYDNGHHTLLLSTRSTTRYPNSRYIVGKLEKMDGMNIFNSKVSFYGSKATPVMTRCAQIAVEANTLVAGYNQDTKLLNLYDVRREKCTQTMPVQEIIYDTCPMYLPSATYLAALTETKCRVYKLIATS